MKIASTPTPAQTYRETARSADSDGGGFDTELEKAGDDEDETGAGQTRRNGSRASQSDPPQAKARKAGAADLSDWVHAGLAFNQPWALSAVRPSDASDSFRPRAVRDSDASDSVRDSDVRGVRHSDVRGVRDSDVRDSDVRGVRDSDVRDSDGPDGVRHSDGSDGVRRSDSSDRHAVRDSDGSDGAAASDGVPSGSTNASSGPAAAVGAIALPAGLQAGAQGGDAADLSLQPAQTGAELSAATGAQPAADLSALAGDAAETTTLSIRGEGGGPALPEGAAQDALDGIGRPGEPQVVTRASEGQTGADTAAKDGAPELSEALAMMDDPKETTWHGPARADLVVGEGADKLRLSILASEHHVRIAAHAASEGAAEAVRAGTDQLREVLRRQGLDLTGVSVHSGGGDAGPRGEQGRSGHTAGESRYGGGSAEPRSTTEDKSPRRGVRIVV